MAEQTRQSGLMSLIGGWAGKAHEQHKKDETTYGIVNLPAGIAGGIAQLKVANWGRYKKASANRGIPEGAPFVYLAGVVISPKEFKGVRCEGQRASLTLPLCDTIQKGRDGVKRITKEENYADVLNEIRKLAGPEYVSETSAQDLEALLDGLQAAKPYFTFSTRGYTPPASKDRPKPEEMVFTQFDGRIDYVPEAAEAGEGSNDMTAAPPLAKSNGAAAHAPTNRIAPKPGKQPAAPVGPAEDADQFSGVDGTSEEGTGDDAGSGEVWDPETSDDVDALVLAANDNDDEPTQIKAQARLAELALAAGMTQEEIEASDTTWEAIAERIINADEEPQPEEEPEEVWTPSKGDTVGYMVEKEVPHPKIKGKKVKQQVKVDFEVMSVNAKDQTVTLKDSASKRLLTDSKKRPVAVNWADLIREE